ncbi:MAG: membrane protein insertase YidC [Clostridia bacterium]|nr:membrane protein insertase YidC [Clostridia bacterium]
MFDFLLKPLGWVLQQFSYLFSGNFAAAVFMFTLVINLLLIPLNIKTQKSSMAQARIKPKLDELKKKYGDDRQKYSMEMQKLYQEENISMSGGCLPMLIRLPIMLGIYQVVLKPLTYIVGVSKEAIAAAQQSLGITGANEYLIQTEIISKINKNPAGYEEIAEKLNSVNFNFLGIDLTSKPEFNIDIINNFELNWLIPVMAFAAAMLTSLVTLCIQKKTNPDAPSMTGMMLTMPLISLFIGFTVSSAAGFYWACSSLISGGIQTVIQTCYGPNKMIANEQTKELYSRYKEEKAIKDKGLNK